MTMRAQRRTPLGKSGSSQHRVRRFVDGATCRGVGVLVGGFAPLIAV